MFSPELAIGQRPTTVRDWVAERAVQIPERVALVADGKAWTYSELDARVSRLARQLAALGARPGDRIATLLHNGTAAATLPHAALRLGATIVPLNVRLTAAEIAWQLHDAAPRVLIVEPRTVDRALTARDENPSLAVATIEGEVVHRLGGLDPIDLEESDVQLRLVHPVDSVLAVIYTSGTTGRPKGAMLTVGNFWYSAIGSALNLGTRDDDRWLAVLPLFHVGGLSIIIRSAIYGITAIVHDGFAPDNVNAAIDDDRTTLVSVVAVTLERLLDSRGAKPFPKTLRVVLLGGGPAPRPLLERCVSSGIPVAQTYGLTETTSQVATLLPRDAVRKLGSAGRVLHPNELQIDPSHGAGVAHAEGEILVRGPIVMTGYLNRPDLTATTITDGWLRTGDIGTLDADGYLYVLDRRDDLIVTGGENVYPAEVETVLLSHPGVIEAAVIGVDDAQWGQRVVAIARLTDDAEANELTLRSFCRERLASYKVPKEIRFVTDPLPRTASEKLQRGALRASEESRKHNRQQQTIDTD
ncbi:MAG: o-succinylbenzoate--CoA ligase [Gemmatimonadales bacterium]